MLLTRVALLTTGRAGTSRGWLRQSGPLSGWLFARIRPYTCPILESSCCGSLLLRRRLPPAMGMTSARLRSRCGTAVVAGTSATGSAPVCEWKEAMGPRHRSVESQKRPLVPPRTEPETYGLVVRRSPLSATFSSVEGVRRRRRHHSPLNRTSAGNVRQAVTRIAEQDQRMPRMT